MTIWEVKLVLFRLTGNGNIILAKQVFKLALKVELFFDVNYIENSTKNFFSEP